MDPGIGAINPSTPTAIFRFLLLLRSSFLILSIPCSLRFFLFRFVVFIVFVDHVADLLPAAVLVSVYDCRVAVFV